MLAWKYLSGMASLAYAPSKVGRCNHLSSSENTPQKTDVSPVMAELSAYMADALNRKLPEEVAEKGKHHILDTLAAVISGSRLAPGKVALKFVREQGGRKEACVVGSRFMTTAVNAAFANGMSAHADETDDSHSPSFSHPGCAVVPAALAMAERNQRSGDDLLKAVLLGYDIGCRVTLTMGVKFYYDEGHKSTHTVVHSFGTHAAAGALSNFDAQKMRWMLAYAAQQAGGTAVFQRDLEHFQKSFDFSGKTARNGVMSAILIDMGFTAVDDVFSGPLNFFLGFAPHADPNGLIRDLGRTYEIMECNIKKWCVGSAIQAPLDCLTHLMTQHDLRPEMIQHIEARVGSHAVSIVDNRDMPSICLQHILALMLLDGTVTFDAAHDYDRMRDPAVLRERAKMTFNGDDELAKSRPKRQGIVNLTLVDGRVLSHRILDVRGTAQNPMHRDEVADKFRSLCEPVLGRNKTKQLISKVWALEKLENIHELRPLLQRLS